MRLGKRTPGALTLEVTFAPTRLNVHEARAVIHRARELGAFRFNTGQLMRIGTAARLWDRLEPSAEQYGEFRALLAREAATLGQEMEFCYSPFTLEEALKESLVEPPATLLVLPNGWVKVAAALPQICSDLRKSSLEHAWRAYCTAWRDDAVIDAVRRAVSDGGRHAEANRWLPMAILNS